MNVDLLVVAAIVLLLSVLVVRYFFRIAILLVLIGVLLMYTGLTVGDLRKILSDPSGTGTSTSNTSTTTTTTTTGPATELLVARQTQKMGNSSSGGGAGSRASGRRVPTMRPREGMNGAPRVSEGDLPPGVSVAPVPARFRPHAVFPDPRLTGRSMSQMPGQGQHLEPVVSTREAPPQIPHKEKRELEVEAARTKHEVHQWEQSRLLPLTAAPARRKFDDDFPPVYHHI